MQRLRGIVANLIARTGIDVTRHRSVRHPAGRRVRLITTHCTDLVLDIGASIGAYGQELRAMGYRGRIVSFEPLKQPFAKLVAATHRDPQWEIYQVALGDRIGTASMHVARNSSSSSLLEMLPRHQETAPESAYMGVEEVRVTTLDELWPKVSKGSRSPFLKLDTQGFEAAILRGARKSLEDVRLLQIELSLVPLYQNQALFREVDAELAALGFDLASIEPGFADEQTGELLQFDGIYRRRDSAI